eukprot:TRINITY_DN801_c0_g1_i3.p1 TRINITY_DN801_c0_g1~~TRINITY_DN801_c0_g1_i3.p1  ORF type:complete len:547 (+),score=74.95 TRINITY_DN801_c0_g1_i3:230-1870(+)
MEIERIIDLVRKFVKVCHEGRIDTERSEILRSTVETHLELPITEMDPDISNVLLIGCLASKELFDLAKKLIVKRRLPFTQTGRLIHADNNYRFASIDPLAHACIYPCSTLEMVKFILEDEKARTFDEREFLKKFRDQFSKNAKYLDNLADVCGHQDIAEYLFEYLLPDRNIAKVFLNLMWNYSRCNKLSDFMLKKYWNEFKKDENRSEHVVRNLLHLYLHGHRKNTDWLFDELWSMLTVQNRMIMARKIDNPEKFYLMAGNLPWSLCNKFNSHQRRDVGKENLTKLTWLSSEVFTRCLYVIEDNPMKTNSSPTFNFHEELGLEFTKWGYPSTDIIRRYCHEDLISSLWRDISFKKWPAVIELLKRASIADVTWYETIDASWTQCQKRENPLKMSLKRKCPPEVIHAFCNVFSDDIVKWDNYLSVDPRQTIEICAYSILMYAAEFCDEDTIEALLQSSDGYRLRRERESKFDDIPLFLACRRADASERMIVALLGPKKERLSFMKNLNGETAEDLITGNRYIDEDLRKLLISKFSSQPKRRKRRKIW